MSHWLERAEYVTETGCLIFTGSWTNAGYGQATVDGKRGYTHRFAYREANGRIPDGLHVCHKCDTPPCCNPEHLFLGTHAENLGDASRKGRMHPGERNYNAKLDREKVRAIRSASKTNAELAAEYGVSQSLISRARRGLSWRRT